MNFIFQVQKLNEFNDCFFPTEIRNEMKRKMSFKFLPDKSN